MYTIYMVAGNLLGSQPKEPHYIVEGGFGYDVHGEVAEVCDLFGNINDHQCVVLPHIKFMVLRR